jgi:voltage-gated potassium channel
MPDHAPKTRREPQTLIPETDTPFKTAWLILVSVTAALTVVAAILIRLTDPKSFPNIGVGLWWAIQTLTTVGYGDVVPHSPLGRLIATLVMITGIAFMTVTTAAVTNILMERARQQREAGRDVHAEIGALSDRVEELLTEVRALRDAGTGRD